MKDRVVRFSEEDWAGFAVRVGREERGLALGKYKEWLKANEEMLDGQLGIGRWTLWEGYEWALKNMPTVPSGVGRERDLQKAERAVEKERAYAEAEAKHAARVEKASRNKFMVEDKDEEETDPYDIQGLNDKVQALVDKYMAYYADVSPNDAASIIELARTEVTLEQLNELLAKEMGRPFPDAVGVRNFSDAKARMSASHRALQDTLNIDRAAREKQQNMGSDTDKALREMDLAVEAGEKFGVSFVHQCVNGEHGSVSQVQFGFMLWMLEEVRWQVRCICPICGKDVNFDFVPHGEQLAAASIPDWVGEEEVEYGMIEQEHRDERMEGWEGKDNEPVGRPSEDTRR